MTGETEKTCSNPGDMKYSGLTVILFKKFQQNCRFYEVFIEINSLKFLSLAETNY